MTDDHVNETDKFVKNQIDQAKKDRKTFKFQFNHETTDSAIYHLNHRRALRIAIAYSTDIEEPLTESFIKDATTDEIHQYLLLQRNECIYQHEYDIFNFNGCTSENSINSLPRLQLENFLIFRYRDSGRIITDEFFDGKTDMELKHLLVSERNMIRSRDLNAPKPNSNDPVKPNDLPKGLHGKRQNLNGWNIDAALSKSNNSLHSRVFHPKTAKSILPGVTPLSKNYFFIPASISTVGNGTHHLLGFHLYRQQLF